MTFIANNLKFLRERQGWKQSEMPIHSGFSQTAWNNYEKGVSKPKVDDLLKISKLFGITVDALLGENLDEGKLTDFEKSGKNQQKGKLNGKPNGKLNEEKVGISGTVNEPFNPYKTAKMPAVVTVAPDGTDNIIYVPIKAQAGYLLGHADRAYMESLPAFQMPGLRTGTYRMFEVSGLSMSPTLSDRDRVICQWVPTIGEIRENRVHVLVLKDGIVIKRVLNRVDDRGLLYLKSDTLTHRADYPIREITPDEILEIWYVMMKVSGDLSEPSELYTRMADMELNMHAVMKELGMLKPPSK